MSTSSAQTRLEDKPANAAFVEIKGLRKVYEPPRSAKSAQPNVVLENVDLSIDCGEFITVIGPSGCGKSTLMNCIAGLIPYDSGSIEIGGRPITGPGSDRVVVFQQASLFPWRTVERNVAYGAELARLGKQEVSKRVRTAIELVGLSGYERHHPHQLSGGMQQRVNLARALVMEAPVILMDEPFGALDAMTKRKLQDELLVVAARINATIIFITHDIEEAVYLGDRVVAMKARPGRIHAIQEIPFERPRPRDIVDTPEFRQLASQLSHQLHT